MGQLRIETLVELDLDSFLNNGFSFGFDFDLKFILFIPNPILVPKLTQPRELESSFKIDFNFFFCS